MALCWADTGKLNNSAGDKLVDILSKLKLEEQKNHTRTSPSGSSTGRKSEPSLIKAAKTTSSALMLRFSKLIFSSSRHWEGWGKSLQIKLHYKLQVGILSNNKLTAQVLQGSPAPKCCPAEANRIFIIYWIYLPPYAQGSQGGSQKTPSFCYHPPTLSQWHRNLKKRPQ